MKKSFIAVIMLSSSLNVFAAAKSPKLDELIDLVTAEQNSPSPAMVDQQVKSIVAQLPADADGKKVKQFSDEIRTYLVSSAKDGAKKMRPYIESAYRESFSDDEVDQLLKFYKSPIGKKMLKEQPTISRKAMSAANEKGVLAEQQKEVMGKIKSLATKYFPSIK